MNIRESEVEHRTENKQTKLVPLPSGKWEGTNTQEHFQLNHLSLGVLRLAKWISFFYCLVSVLDLPLQTTEGMLWWSYKKYRNKTGMKIQEDYLPMETWHKRKTRRLHLLHDIFHRNNLMCNRYRVAFLSFFPTMFRSRVLFSCFSSLHCSCTFHRSIPVCT